MSSGTGRSAAERTQLLSQYIGGLSPRFDAIQTEKTKATNMMNLLYLHQKKYFGQREFKIFLLHLFGFTLTFFVS